METTYTLLTIFDGVLFTKGRIYDSFNVIVKGTMIPVEIANLDSHVYTQYIIFKDKLNAHKTVLTYLKDHGFEVIPALSVKIDFSGERS